MHGYEHKNNNTQPSYAFSVDWNDYAFTGTTAGGPDDILAKKISHGIDFIICKLCNFHGKSLGAHVRRIHNISPKEYKAKYGDIICSNSSNIYVKSNSVSGDWINRAKQNGEDLTEYKLKMGSAVRNSILSNDNDRERRAEVMAKVNQTEFMKRKASDTAKKTSARKDIQKKRSLQLKKWRDENPEEFYDKCISKMVGYFHSKPELKLFHFMKSFENFNFKLNRFIKSDTFTTITKKRQIDIGDDDNGIFVEFDGIFHFLPKFGEEVLKQKQKKDQEIDEYIQNQKMILIRVSYDQYQTKIHQMDKIKFDASCFRQECLDEIINILNYKKPGVYRIGNKYDKY